MVDPRPFWYFELIPPDHVLSCPSAGSTFASAVMTRLPAPSSEICDARRNPFPACPGLLKRFHFVVSTVVPLNVSSKKSVHPVGVGSGVGLGVGRTANIVPQCARAAFNW